MDRRLNSHPSARPKLALGLFALIVSALAMPSSAPAAGPCQTSGEVALSTDRAYAWGPPLYNSACTGAPSGAATMCDVLNFPSTFAAIWPSETARVNDAVGGCVFTCPGGSCRMGNDGLPVELIGFGVE